MADTPALDFTAQLAAAKADRVIAILKSTTPDDMRNDATGILSDADKVMAAEEAALANAVGNFMDAARKTIGYEEAYDNLAGLVTLFPSPSVLPDGVFAE